jgi:hypothetical protein
MPYPLQRRHKSESRLTPEEEEVLQALAPLYTDDPERAALDDFTPTRVLYRAYLDYVNRFDHLPGDPEVLTQHQFGAAIRRAFAELGDHSDYRVQRTVKGRRVWGFLGITGPGTVKIRTGPGNPRIRQAKRRGPARKPAAYEAPEDGTAAPAVPRPKTVSDAEGEYIDG